MRDWTGLMPAGSVCAGAVGAGAGTGGLKRFPDLTCGAGVGRKASQTLPQGGWFDEWGRLKCGWLEEVWPVRVTFSSGHITLKRSEFGWLKSAGIFLSAFIGVHRRPIRKTVGPPMN